MTVDKDDINEDEYEFKVIGLNAYFDVETDKNINWEEFFQLSDDEQFFAANNNQIIEDGKTEDRIWSKYLSNPIK